MSVRRAGVTFAIGVAVVGRLGAQVRDDSTAVASAVVRFILSHPAAGGESPTVAGVTVDSGRATWGAYAGSMLKASLSSAATRPSDTAQYYAMRVRLDSVVIGAATATAWATWSQCIQSRANESMNFWVHPIAYTLVKSDSGWVGTAQRIMMFMDGQCSAFRSRP